jgi:hypothetical protein
MAHRRTTKEIHTLLDGYRHRSGTRAEYCRQQGIADSTLDYYLRRYGRQTAGFAKVKLTPSVAEASTAFALVLRTGRRIEGDWNFRDADLARLIRIAEAE